MVLRRQRRHGDLPAGFVWREGRPRWLPSPTRRSQGWGIHDLYTLSTDGRRQWLSKGEAIEACDRINLAVRVWTERREGVPREFAAFAPPGSVEGLDTLAGNAPPARPPRSIGALIDAYVEALGQRDKSPATIVDYRSKLRRLCVALAAGEENKAEAILDLPIDALAAPRDEFDPFPLESAYEWLRARTPSQAYGVLSVTGAWLSWCWKKKRIRCMAINPVPLIERRRPDGRIRVASKEEIAALIKAADQLGLASVADAVTFGIDLGWSLGDILRLEVGQFREVTIRGRRRVLVRGKRAKTGVITEPPLGALGQARHDLIKARRAAARVVRPEMIVSDRSCRPWTPRAFNTVFNRVRERAAQTVPIVADFTFMDTRDTCITLCREARMTIEQTASRSQHKPSRVQAVWEKHYGAITPLIAETGADAYDAHLAAEGWLDALA